ncbi:MAG TPA: GNAT family N-acetyltransferase [Spirillospora sp.]|nr:GNAT family N-acetyltransferase [Spirillospora sp.]
MHVYLCRAEPAHAVLIGKVKTCVWPDEPVDTCQIERALQRPDHVSYVALTVTGAVAGFVDAFPTRSVDGRLRWEVDLLAVHPDYQGQKLGQRLVAAVTDAGFGAGMMLARALVQIDNHACQGALRRCGYATDGQVYQLIISTAQADTLDSVPDGTHLIEVETMNYNGLWLEGTITTASLRAGQTERTRRGCDLVGALIPVEQADLLAAAQALGYTPVEQFQWWMREAG